MAPGSHGSDFNECDKELSSKWPLAVTSHISMSLIRIVEEMATSSHTSCYNDFDKEWLRKWPLAVTGHISMILIRNVKEMAPSSHRSYSNDRTHTDLNTMLLVVDCCSRLQKSICPYDRDSNQHSDLVLAKRIKAYFSV